MGNDLLQVFAGNNPEASLLENEDHFIVRNPWGDDSVELIVPFTQGDLIASLNAVRLPPRFTALVHCDSRDVEFIFGEIPKDDPLRVRSFDFVFRASTMRCEYVDASARLVSIANSFRQVGPPGDSAYRNLFSVRSSKRKKKDISEDPKLSSLVLTSFWVRNAMLSDDDLVAVARHLNFYMKYYDPQSPTILVHDDVPEKTTFPAPSRYPHGDYPEIISARDIDEYILSLWETASGSRNAVQKYIYHFQILEYAAFYYLRDDVSRSIKKVLLSPNVLSCIDDASRQLLDIVAEDRTSDEAKMSQLLQQYIDPLRLWPTVERFKDCFSRETAFEGGFVLPPLIKSDWKGDDFCSAYIPKLPDTLRKLRNALVHAREMRSPRCILPSRKNSSQLRPWSNLIEAVSGEIVVYAMTGWGDR